MPRRKKEDKSRAVQHTAIIDSPIRMWEKMFWDVVVFQDTQRMMPDEDQPLVYAAINACISAESLGYWVTGVWRPQQHSERDMLSLLNTAVPGQATCSAIANTAKHARFREGGWSGGKVSLVEVAGDEDGPGGWTLRYDCDGSSVSAYVIFDDLVRDWWAFLCTTNLAKGQMPLPKWYQNKLHRIFG